MLRIVAWDDPRCVQPLEAACEQWSALHSEECRIVRRPLTAFNDQPLSELAPVCDVMIIDYPHVAQAIEENAITAICDLLPPAAIETIRDGAIAPAQDSFVVRGRDLGVNVNAIAPGYISTDNTEALRNDSARYQAILERIPAGRWGEPEDFAGPVVFLASPAAAYVHGTILTVDGGWMGR